MNGQLRCTPHFQAGAWLQLMFRCWGAIAFFSSLSTDLGSRYAGFYRNDVFRLTIGHQLRHALRVNAVDVAVRIQDQFAAVAMALPFGDDFDINAKLDCASDEHAAQRSL